MQLTIPAPVLSANQQVLGALRRASVDTQLVQQRVEAAGRVPAGTRQLLESALAGAQQAADGVAGLGAGNLLDGTFQRYTTHSVRHLQRAVEMLARPGQLGRDATAIFTKVLFGAEVATRLGAQAGDRSLANPSPRSIERASEFVGGGEGTGGGATWVDGEWLDGLGNPVRGGGDSSTGPDGEGYGWDGSPDRGGESWVGPDGEGYSGI